VPLNPWLVLRHLDFRYGPREVLREINLDFHSGRHYILAGPNGAGKSTLLDLLANLKNVAAGGIMLRGRPLGAHPAPALARLLALAPQDDAYNFAFTVREVAAMGRRPYLGRWGRLTGGDLAAVDQALDWLDLTGLAEQSVTALSGGEKKRVALARVLAQATQIILLDEPTAGLDVAHALTVMGLARRRAEAGALVITVTHDLNLGAAFGHEFVFLKNGRVAAAGPVERTFTAPILAAVYEAEAAVTRDEFTGGLAASFRASSDLKGQPEAGPFKSLGSGL
jgi:iron complex transport system ATP-binding protein